MNIMVCLPLQERHQPAAATFASRWLETQRRAYTHGQRKFAEVGPQVQTEHQVRSATPEPNALRAGRRYPGGQRVGNISQVGSRKVLRTQKNRCQDVAWLATPAWAALSYAFPLCGRKNRPGVSDWSHITSFCISAAVDPMCLCADRTHSPPHLRTQASLAARVRTYSTKLVAWDQSAPSSRTLHLQPPFLRPWATLLGQWEADSRPFS